MLRERTNSRTVLTVSQLTRDIKAILENCLPEVYVTGEVSNLSTPSSGHIYFTLKDAAAQIRAVFFRDQNRLSRFALKDGMQVLCSGRIGVYEKQGNYQLYVNIVEPKGVGSLQLAFEQLKEKLSKEGLFDPAKKKPMPAFPSRIAIISSSTGAVIHDMLTILRRRAFSAQVSLFPVRVQGQGAAEEIVGAIKLANKFSDQFDCLLLARGGGSLEDLWAFNEESVARAVFSSTIPTVSAIGHEVDWTICDFVADLRAPTPSAAIELLVVSREELAHRVKESKRRLEQYMLQKVPQYQQQLDEFLVSLGRSLSRLIKLKKIQLKGFSDRLVALSPLNILERGYSITIDNKSGQVIKDARKVSISSVLTTLLARGKIESTVTGSSDEKGSHAQGKEI